MNTTENRLTNKSYKNRELAHLTKLAASSDD